MQTARRWVCGRLDCETNSPRFPLPLLAQERATLDLQSALHQAYEAAGYADYIYTNAPTPPLQGADAEWVQQVITIQRT